MTIQNAMLVPAIPDNALGGPVCSGCGVPPRQRPDGTTEKIVATGMTADVTLDPITGALTGTGVIVFCETCLKWLGSLVGLVDLEEGKARVSDVRRSQRREAKIRAAEEKRVHAVSALQDAEQALEDLAEAMAS